MPLEHLIVVAGHAIPHRFDQLDRDEGWFLKPFQKGEGRFYVEHVRAAVRLAAEDESALLVFSGGQTDGAAGPRSEGQGYWLIAERHQWEGCPDVRERAAAEEYALDSFLNVLYGLCRFHEWTGGYPRALTVVGWRFKERRFDFHRETVGFPARRYRYVGVNDPEELELAERFEQLRLEDFRQDPYGRFGELAEKRAARNPFARRHGYQASCPELAGLLEHKGPERYSGPLPWD